MAGIRTTLDVLATNVSRRGVDMDRGLVIRAIGGVRPHLAAQFAGKGAKLYHCFGALLLVGSIAACVPASTATAPASTTALATELPLPTATEPTATGVSTAVVPPTTVVSPTGEVASEPDQANSNEMEANLLNIAIGDRVLSATLVENSSVDALLEVLSEGPMTVNMRDYGSMEKVGPLGMSLPRNDKQITTEAGDIILYQGDALVIYYAPNTWNFTRLGKVDDVSAEELKEILGEGNVTITLSLP
jgi:hypothetical protein